MARFEGIIPAVTTPFDASGSVDEAALERNVAAYLVMMRDKTDPCGYGYASADDGIVLEGHRVGPPQPLITR